jgi:flagellar hook-associated protein 3 FlgL
MKASFVSNMSLQNAMRLTVATAQKEMLKVQEESVTGRHSDVGAVLGAKTARTLNLHRDLQRMESLKSTNALTFPPHRKPWARCRQRQMTPWAC